VLAHWIHLDLKGRSFAGDGRPKETPSMLPDNIFTFSLSQFKFFKNPSEYLKIPVLKDGKFRIQKPSAKEKSPFPLAPPLWI